MIFFQSKGVSQIGRVLCSGVLIGVLAGCSDTGSTAIQQSAAAIPSEPTYGQFEQEAPTFSDAIQPAEPERYFFDVNGHSQAEVGALLERTKEVYEAAAAESKEPPKVTMVLHGPDVQYFASSNYAENRNLVDLAAKLDAFGFIDLKVCAVSTQSLGIAESDYPKFIEVVPYGPAVVARLQQQGVPRF